MYTQCPDCSTAFRVTADVLKQAAGKVRCGGCGNAFNALAYLSETLPEHPAPKKADTALPKLEPEPNRSRGLPKSISAEQSAALLKTLDELAGSDIRIEDTGVEWRVLLDDEVGDAAGDTSSGGYEAPAASSIDELQIDELLDESPTPVDQFLTETPAVVDSPEIFETDEDPATPSSVDELRFDDNTPLPEDFDPAGNDFSPDRTDVFAADLHFQSKTNIDAKADATQQTDFELSEPDEWTDILGEFEDLAAAVAAPPNVEFEAENGPGSEPLANPDAVQRNEGAKEPAPEFNVPDEVSIDAPLDMDSQFALQAEALGLELSGVHEDPEVEAEIAGAIDDAVDLEELLSASGSTDLQLESLLDEELVEETGAGTDLQLAEDAMSIEEELVALDEEVDKPVEPEADLPEERAEAKPGLADKNVEPGLPGGPVVAPMTQEEETINLQIDQDLLALAVEDEDGFASTIAIADSSIIEGPADKKSRARKDPEQNLTDSDAGVETIIMEGEAIRSTEDLEKLEVDTLAAAALSGAAAADRAAEQEAGKHRNRYRIIGGIVVLVLLLAAQVVHQSRETLATIPAFNNTVGPLYRAIGQPLSPAWDVTGWRFEATKGSTEEDKLTIYSRLGNKSGTPLPYPLIGISLTDRFEETVGSRVLDPADYLSNDLDPRELVRPGNTFNAVITIQSPAEEATGFKLNVCYRESGGNLRCAIDDFK